MTLVLCVVDNGDVGAPCGEPEWDLPEICQGLANVVVAIRWREEQKKASRAGAEDLPTSRSCVEGALVPAIDVRVADLVDQPLLQEPALVQEPADRVHLACSEALTELVGEVAHRLQRGDRASVLNCRLLLLEHLRGRPLTPGVEHQERAMESLERPRWLDQRLDA